MKKGVIETLNHGNLKNIVDVNFLVKSMDGEEEALKYLKDMKYLLVINLDHLKDSFEKNDLEDFFYRINLSLLICHYVGAFKIVDAVNELNKHFKETGNIVDQKSYKTLLKEMARLISSIDAVEKHN